MPDSPFVSYGQNREDVVLWRALGHLDAGRYVEVGGNDPELFSVTKAFHDRGWRGLSVEPDPVFAARLRAARPLDTVMEAAATSHEGDVTLHRFANTGLSTLADDVRDRHRRDGRDVEELVVRGARLDTLLRESGTDQGEVHFAVVDVEGAEADVLASVDLRRWRPWVLVVEATEPLSRTSAHAQWEPAVLEAGYEFCLFDGVSRFYVAEEHADLRPALSYPACALDSFVDHEASRHRDLITELTDDVLRWRRAALTAWAEGIAQKEIDERTRREIEDLQRDLRKARRRATRLEQERGGSRPSEPSSALGALRRAGSRALRRP